MTRSCGLCGSCRLSSLSEGQAVAARLASGWLRDSSPEYRAAGLATWTDLIRVLELETEVLADALGEVQ